MTVLEIAGMVAAASGVLAGVAILSFLVSARRLSDRR
jgi:hypothetical protein